MNKNELKITNIDNQNKLYNDFKNIAITNIQKGYYTSVLDKKSIDNAKSNININTLSKNDLQVYADIQKDLQTSFYKSKLVYKNTLTKDNKELFQSIASDILNKVDCIDNILKFTIDKKDYNELTTLANTVLYLHKKIEYTTVKKALITAYKNKYTTNKDDKKRHYVGDIFSISEFLKVIQNNNYNGIITVDYYEYHKQQKAKQQLKKDRELQKAKQKANKTIEKQQKANNNLKTKID